MENQYVSALEYSNFAKGHLDFIHKEIEERLKNLETKPVGFKESLARINTSLERLDMIYLAMNKRIIHLEGEVALLNNPKVEEPKTTFWDKIWK